MLEARNLSFGYARGAAVLENWSSTFSAGEVVAITGPSGRGKSTLLYLLGLMLRPRGGDLQIDGASVINLSDSKKAELRAQQFGFVFQDAALDPSRSVIDNVTETALYRGADLRQARRRGNSLLEQFGVDLRSSAKPGEVSGGQAQRIALCRALLNDPRILLADEPTGNLDPVSSDVVINAFHAQAAAGATVIIVTHDPELVARCTRRVEL